MRWNYYTRQDLAIKYANHTPGAWVEGPPNPDERWWCGDHDGATHCVLVRADGSVTAMTRDDKSRHGWPKKTVIVKHMFVRIVV